MDLNNINHVFECNNAYENIINKIEFDLGHDMKSNNFNLNKYLQKTLYFVTIQLYTNFTDDFYSIKRQNITNESLDKFYYRLSSMFISRSVDNNSKYQPLLQLYLDDENSRYNAFMRPISKPHFHGLLLIHPKTADQFDKFYQSNGLFGTSTEVTMRNLDLYPIETVTFSKFDPEIGSLRNLISYTTKFARNQRFINGNDGGIELLRVYPRTSSKKYPFYKSPTCKISTNIIIQ
ncbi:hypothetical protein EV561_104111 [Rhizobium sp. BK376]|nr:hypothetical protein EV561_104111 [Rhizobium sp. BK376]